MSADLLLTLVRDAALALGAIAAAAALYGRHATLPAFLTGPQICKLEAGGCQVLFRTPTAALLGVPNAVLGLLLYALLVIGLVERWPSAWLLAATAPALLMSLYLARYLLVNRLECRICWTGHVANALLFAALLLELLQSPDPVGPGR